MAEGPHLRMSTREDLKAAIVLDCGTGRTKAGFAGTDNPAVIISSIVGRPKQQSIMLNANKKSCYVGEEAKCMAGVLKLTYPIVKGIMTDWADIEKIWHNIFYDQLAVKPDEHPVLLTEVPMNPKANRERMIQMMIETFDVPAFYLATQAVLALYAVAKTTGAVLDCGDGVSHVVPVYEGYSLPHAVMRLEVAGRNITDYMIKILQKRHADYSFTTTAETEIVRAVKEKFGYVSLNFDKDLEVCTAIDDLSQATDRQTEEQYTGVYELPDGNLLELTSERFRCTEVLFQPSMLSLELPGLHYLIKSAIEACALDIRKELYQNILLCGATTKFPNFPERIRMEVQNMVSAATVVKVIAPDNRDVSVFVGGSTLADLTGFSHMWITKEEYEADGPTIVHKKCL